MRTGHHGPDFTVKDCKGFYSLSVNNEDEISDFPPKAFMRHVCFLFLLNLLLCDSLCVCVCVCVCVCLVGCGVCVCLCVFGVVGVVFGCWLWGDLGVCVGVCVCANVNYVYYCMAVQKTLQHDLALTSQSRPHRSNQIHTTHNNKTT